MSFVFAGDLAMRLALFVFACLSLTLRADEPQGDENSQLPAVSRFVPMSERQFSALLLSLSSASAFAPGIQTIRKHGMVSDRLSEPSTIFGSLRHGTLSSSDSRASTILATDQAQKSSTPGDDVEANTTAAEQDSPRFMSKAWFSKWAKFDKDKIKRLGIDAFFTYGVVSNLNVALTTAIAWGIASKATGLSPLAPGQWKNFLSVYAGLYLSLGSILRPFRMALAVGMTPVYGNAVARFRNGLPFRETRPKLNRTLALVAISLLLNVFGTFSLVGLGAYIAGVITGVPAFPPGWQLGA